jgi:hypothetical protein
MEAREEALTHLVRPAGEMYAGVQHRYLRHGLAHAERRPDVRGHLFIISALYGLIPASYRVTPYECTFGHMPRVERRAWADGLGVPDDVRDLLASASDFTLVVLGDDYIEAADLGDDMTFGGPTLFFVSPTAASRLPSWPHARVVGVPQSEVPRFPANNIGIKGKLGERVLRRIGNDPDSVSEIMSPAVDLIDVLAEDHQQSNLFSAS